MGSAINEFEGGIVAVSEGEQNTIVRPPQSEAGRRLTVLIDRFVRQLARHWLAIFNTIVAIFVALPFLAPVLMHAGVTTAGKAIYFLYMPTCHQLPVRSYFLFGPRVVYSEAELEALGAMPKGLSLVQQEALRFPGNPQVGYKVAFCERDAAIYGGVTLAKSHLIAHLRVAREAQRFLLYQAETFRHRSQGL